MSTPPILIAAAILAELLEAAHDGAVPMPYTADVDTWAPYGHGSADDNGGIALTVGSLADLTAWSTYLDEPIDDSREPRDGKVHTHVYGMAGVVPVRVTALVPVAVSA